MVYCEGEVSLIGKFKKGVKLGKVKKGVKVGVIKS